MSSFPIKPTRRWREIKFLYTQDDGKNILTSQRFYKDTEGNFFLAPNQFLLDRELDEKKYKFWGKPENLRKIKLTYEEETNVAGKANIKRYCPLNASQNIGDFIKEEYKICNAKFNDFNVRFCIDYEGENRFSKNKPTKLND